MTLNRREFVAALGAGGIQTCLPGLGFAVDAMATGDVLLVHDSRLAQGNDLADRFAAQARRRIDIVATDDRSWYELAKSGLAGVRRIEGRTGWRDFVVLRDAFRDGGFRPASPEQRSDLPTGRTLFSWRLDRR